MEKCWRVIYFNKLNIFLTKIILLIDKFLKTMLRIFVTNLFFLSITLFSFGQELPQKEKIYLLFEKNNGKYLKYLGKKFNNKEGINFNLYKYYFFHKKNMQRDTLSLWHLKNYRITKEKDIDSLEKKWRTENEDQLKKTHLLYKQMDRNGVFDITIIEKINDSLIVFYDVIFRNEGVQK